MPAIPVLKSPVGSATPPAPTYRWTAAAQAQSYNLWVNDAGGTRLRASFSAAHAGCDLGAECAVTSNVSLGAGAGKWWVQAENELGKSAWSAPLSFTVLAGRPGTPVPAAPTGNVVTATPTYRWAAATDAAEYYLWVNDSRGTRVQQLSSAVQAGCALSSACAVTPAVALQSGSAQFWVQARNALGSSAWSAPLAFTVSVTSAALSAPILTAPSGTVATSTPTYQWAAVPGASAYQLWVNDANGVRVQQSYTAAELGCATSSSCSASPITPVAAGSVRFWAQARSGAVTSAWSAPLVFTSAPPACEAPYGPLRSMRIVEVAKSRQFNFEYARLRNTHASCAVNVAGLGFMMASGTPLTTPT